MKRHIPGLDEAVRNISVPEGIFLARVEQATYSSSSRKPYFNLRFAVLEPPELAGRTFSGRLYCTEKALWKLYWFLRDFGYETECLQQEHLDEKELAGLRGIVKVSHTNFNGRSHLNLDAFAPASAWKEIATASPDRADP